MRRRSRRDPERPRLAWPPGHFYSPLPDLEQLARDADRVFGAPARSLPGIDVAEEDQLALVRELEPLGADPPWDEAGRSGLRFAFGNGQFERGEVIPLLGLMRLLRPRRLVEVGSGFSSAAALDVDETFLDRGVSFTFIDPHPEVLRSLLRADDRPEILDRRLQEVPTEVFAALAPGDFLVIDSSHVVKTDSDVHHVLFRVLPAIAPGVLVHFHDVHWPFEYPREWVLAGRGWNEVYVLRAFLQDNDAYRIRYLGSYLGEFHRDALERHLPSLRGQAGSSMWLEKLR